MITYLKNKRENIIKTLINVSLLYFCIWNTIDKCRDKNYLYKNASIYLVNKTVKTGFPYKKETPFHFRKNTQHDAFTTIRIYRQ